MSYQCKYFSPSEFKRCVPSCSIDDMDKRLLIVLDDLRTYCGFPIILNSAYRSVDWEKAHGRSGTSSHTKGLAVDIRCTDDFERGTILSYVYSDAYNTHPAFRVGIGKTYLHLDIDFDKPYVCWVY